MLAILDAVQNILKCHLPGHVYRLKDALAALPDSSKSPESGGLPSSSGLSFAASAISLNYKDSQEDSQVRDADGFVVPPRPGSTQVSQREKQLEAALQRQRQLQEKQLEEALQRQRRQMQEEGEKQLEEALQRQKEQLEEESRKRQER